MKISEALSTAESVAKSGSSHRSIANAFRLTGPSRKLDPRSYAVRRDIADIDLAAHVFAPHYASAEIQSVTQASAMILTAARNDAEASSQLLQGESFAILDITGDWAWGYCLHDHYVGYIRADALGAGLDAPTHIVSAREAPVFASANIKTAARETLSLGAHISGTVEGNFVATARGYIHSRHLISVDDTLADPVATAEKLIGAPYLWGGRGAGGADCSGLVQLALKLSGLPCPRDSDQQCETLGTSLSDGAQLQRGDLIFFPGHVGIMYDQTRLLHANAYWMAVTIEPLGDVIARLRESTDTPVIARKRLSS